MSSQDHDERPARTRPRRIRRGAPPVIVLASLVGLALLVLPLVGLVVRAPWRSVGATLGRPELRSTLRLSLVCSVCATVIATTLGVPLAWMLARVEWRGRAVLRALATLPVILPPVVGGLALLLVLGRNGILGRHLDAWFGVRLPFSTAGAVLAETFVAMPFLVLSLEGAFAGADRRIEEAAETLGASPWTVLRRVTLPAVRPSLLAGIALCWARALGEFGATITFAGSFPGRTQTMPLAVYQAFETDPPSAIVLSLVLVAISLTVLISLRGHLLGRR